MIKVLSETEILTFEKHCNIRLPEAYRMFLKEVGNGCCMIDGFRLKQLQDIEWENLSYPFIPKEAWIWEDDYSVTEQVLCEMQEVIIRGEIELIDIGDAMGYHLIVTGECRGEVWHFTDAGIQPCCERQDVLGWFELWLDNQEDADYFKDYIKK